MKCLTTTSITTVILIAMSISLSTNLYAQVRPYNDECSEAIQLPVAPETSFNEFSLEGALRSTFVVASTCGNDQVARDVWFTVIMPDNGKLHVELSATKECPALTLYSGGCTGLGYLACDASKNDQRKKVIQLVDADLAGKKVFIRVHQEEASANNIFNIKTTSIETATVSVNSLEVYHTGKDIMLAWKTFGELEVYYTLIQHSIDGENFENIQSIEGRNNNDLEHYTFKHHTPQVGKNVYRLVMVMDSGEAIVFDEIEIFVEQYNAMVRIFPNPTTQGVFLEMPTWVKNDTAQFFMIDMSGKVIYDYSLAVNASEEIYVDFSDLKIGNGNYLITLTQGDEMIMNSQLSIQH